MKVEKLDRNRYAVNTYILYNEDTKNAIIIDPAVNYNAIVDFIEANKLKPLAILLTHGHIDHIADCILIKEKYDILIYAHELEREVLNTPEINLGPHFGYADFSIEADKWLKDKDILRFEEFEFEVIHTPGHSKGGVTFVIDKMLFTGDTLFRASMGRVDLPTSNPEHMRASLYKLSQFDDDYIVYPGHSGTSTMLNEKAINPYIRSL